jgi:hypothetical protein
MIFDTEVTFSITFIEDRCYILTKVSGYLCESADVSV